MRDMYDEKIDKKETIEKHKSLVRINNSNWATKSDSNLDISLNILKILICISRPLNKFK